jgi:hypothetical protein
MNWLTKINLTVVVTRLGAFRSAILLLSIIGIAGYSGYRIGNYYHGYQAQVIAKKDQQLQKLYQQQEQNSRNIHFLEAELEIEKLANQRSIASLKEMEKEHYRIKKELGFYEKVMAPEKQAEGIVIDNLSIEATESKRHYRFQVVLVQQDKRKKYAKGYIDLVFTGSQNNKPKTYKLSELVANTENSLAFNFKYFQNVEGEFTLPAGFIPEQVGLSAILPKGRWQKYHRLDESYSWSAVIDQE